MLVLPGPAVIVIPAGLTVLATEFGWARRVLARVKKRRVLARVKKSFQTDPKDNPQERGNQAIT
jgi:tellurite resistance protein TerC